MSGFCSCLILLCYRNIIQMKNESYRPIRKIHNIASCDNLHANIGFYITYCYQVKYYFCHAKKMKNKIIRNSKITILNYYNYYYHVRKYRTTK